MRFTACTPCFRAEAGAAGKDTRGMIRQHQFTKVELVSITTPEQSQGRARAHAVLRRGSLAAARPALSRDDVVHRRHGLCVAKDLRHRGLAAGQNMYREISSCSVCGEFQARRMNARYRTKEGRAGAPRAHAQRLRRRRRPRADRGDGDLSAGRRLDCGARRAAVRIHGRHAKDREVRLQRRCTPQTDCASWSPTTTASMRKGSTSARRSRARCPTTSG